MFIKIIAKSIEEKIIHQIKRLPNYENDNIILYNQPENVNFHLNIFEDNKISKNKMPIFSNVMIVQKNTKNHYIIPINMFSSNNIDVYSILLTTMSKIYEKETIHTIDKNEFYEIYNCLIKNSPISLIEYIVNKAPILHFVVKDETEFLCIKLNLNDFSMIITRENSVDINMQLTLNMSKDEIIYLLGSPTCTITNNNNQILIYSHITAFNLRAQNNEKMALKKNQYNEINDENNEEKIFLHDKYHTSYFVLYITDDKLTSFNIDIQNKVQNEVIKPN